MKVDERFAARVSELAAEIVCDGWPHGTFDDPESTLPEGIGVEIALKRAAHHIWGGPGWWRRNMTRAEKCLQSIRWQVCDGQAYLSFAESEKQSRARWTELDVGQTVFMLLLASQALKSWPNKSIDTAALSAGSPA
jgi:hypothetical protein